MGTSNQVIVFPFFGDKYAEQFKVCSETIPNDWDVMVISDQDLYLFCEGKGYQFTRIPHLLDEFQKMTFRKDIPEYINISKYNRV